jgi:hypothetical protein
MRFRTLGKTGLEISEVGYGAWGIGGKQWQGGNDTESLAALRRALELGLNFIDTALAYGDGHSEQLVGDIVRADLVHRVGHSFFAASSTSFFPSAEVAGRLSLFGTRSRVPKYRRFGRGIFHSGITALVTHSSLS